MEQCTWRMNNEEFNATVRTAWGTFNHLIGTL